MDRALRLLVPLSVAMGLVASLGPGTAVAQQEAAVMLMTDLLAMPSLALPLVSETEGEGVKEIAPLISTRLMLPSASPAASLNKARHGLALSAVSLPGETMSPSICQSTTDGVVYCYENGTHVLLIDLTDPTIRFETVIANDFGYVNVEWCDGQPCYLFPVESVGHIATRDPYRNQGVIAAINADYFAYDRSHGPEGLTVKNGQRIDGPHSNDYDGNEENRSSLAISANNEANIGKGLGTQQPYLYNAVGGGPQIISNGQYIPIQQACANEGFSAYWCNEATAVVQTVAGLSQDRHTLILAVSSGQKTASQIAQVLINRGAWTGIKLDGGGSSQLWYNGQTLKWGSRDVANALLVFKGTTSNRPPNTCLLYTSPSPRD